MCTFRHWFHSIHIFLHKVGGTRPYTIYIQTQDSSAFVSLHYYSIVCPVIITYTEYSDLLYTYNWVVFKNRFTQISGKTVYKLQIQLYNVHILFQNEYFIDIYIVRHAILCCSTFLLLLFKSLVRICGKYNIPS